jgi:hypothetical protein
MPLLISKRCRQSLRQSPLRTVESPTPYGPGQDSPPVIIHLIRLLSVALQPNPGPPLLAHHWLTLRLVVFTKRGRPTRRFLNCIPSSFGRLSVPSILQTTVSPSPIHPAGVQLRLSTASTFCDRPCAPSTLFRASRRLALWSFVPKGIHTPPRIKHLRTARRRP